MARRSTSRSAASRSPANTNRSHRERATGSGFSQRCCSSWRLPSRSQRSRPWVRATIRSASSSSGTSPAGSCSGSSIWLRDFLAVRWPRPLASVAEELAPALRRAQLLRQLITALIAMHLILGLVRGHRLSDHVPGDLFKLIVNLRAGVARDPGAVDRHHPGLHQPGLITQLEHLAEQPGQRPLVPTDERGDRHMVRNQVARDHPVGNVLPAVTLDRPRRPHTGRERVQDQRHHQRRLIRGAAMTISAISGIERVHVHLVDRADHKPRQVIRRQPVPHIRRQEKIPAHDTLRVSVQSPGLR